MQNYTNYGLMLAFISITCCLPDKYRLPERIEKLTTILCWQAQNWMFTPIIIIIIYFFANSSLLFPRYWMARLFLLVSAIAKPRKLSWLVPSYRLIPESFWKNHLDPAGIEPRSLASFPPQATALSITPWPFGLQFFKIVICSQL